jgi:PhnB protein
MSTQLIAYLMFEGQAKDAMDFYRSVFGGKLVSQTYAEIPGYDGGTPDLIMHAQLESEGFTIMASDNMGEDPINAGNQTCLTFVSNEEKRMNDFYLKLSEGGKVIDELSEKFWGDKFGVVEDKFGMTWMFNVSKA